MPNWCENRARIVAPTEADAIAFEREFKAGNLMNFYLPVDAVDAPHEGGRLPKWYVERTTLWGVKWDVGSEHTSIERDGCDIDCSFMTAWSAPIPFFRHLLTLGFTFDLTYFEPNMIFGGRFNGLDYDSWSHDCREELTPESFPSYLYDAFGPDFSDFYFDELDEEEAGE